MLLDAGFVPMTSDDAYVSALFGYLLIRLGGWDFGDRLSYDLSLLDDPVVLEAAQALEYMAYRGFFHENIEHNVWPTGQYDIASGDVTMYLNGTWLVNEIFDTTGPDFRWGAFNWPVFPNGMSGMEAATFGSQAFAINRNSPYPQEAFELIVHLTTGLWDEVLAAETFGVPVSGLAMWPHQLEEARVIFDNLTQAVSWVAGVEDHPEAGVYVRLNVQRLVGGSITAEEFIENIKARR